VRVRAFSKVHPKVRAHEGRGSRGPLPIAVGTLILVEVERLPRGERRREPRVLWLWWHGPEGEAPDLGLLWRAYVRRFDLEHTFRFLKQSMGWTTPRVRHPQQARVESDSRLLVYANTKKVGVGQSEGRARKGDPKARPLPNLTPSPLNVVNVHSSVFKAYPLVRAAMGLDKSLGRER